MLLYLRYFLKTITKCHHVPQKRSWIESKRNAKQTSFVGSIISSLILTVE